MVASRFTFAAAGLLCASLALPVPSYAQATREGPTFAASGAWPGAGQVRRPDIAYDPINNVYLVISGPLAHGRFVNADGAPLGADFAFSTAPAAWNQTPRVAYGDGKFLVTWLDVRLDPRGGAGWVWGRLVSFGTNGAPAFAGPDFLVGAAAPAVDPERAPALAFSTVSKNFLVVFHQYGTATNPAVPLNDIRGQLVSSGGGLVGPPINVSFDKHFQGEVGVGYSPASNKFLVAYRNYYEPNGPATVQTKTVAADTGVLGVAADIEAAANVNVPEVVWDVKSGQFFVAWWRGVPGGGMYLGRFINPDGTAADVAKLLINNYGGYDSLGIDYNTLADTFFAVIHGRAPSTFPQEDVGAEISGAAVPSVEFDVTATGNKLGNFNPRIAASSARNEWMMVTSTGFAVASGQRIKTLAHGGGPPPPPPPPPPPIELSGPAVPNGSWFLAEGAESGTPTGFHTFYLVANENDEPVEARAWFCGDDGRLKYQAFTVAARSRTTISLSGAVGSGAFGSIFQSVTPGKDIYVARSIYWGPNLEGSTGVSATKDLSTTWYFAEGSRGGELFDNFFLIFNPLPDPTTVEVNFLTAGGEVITKSYTVQAQKRLTLYANAVPELAGKDFSTTIVGQTGIIAERAMYWRLIGGIDPSWVGGTASIGAIAPQTTWVFAEGAAAPRFETFYLLLNPNQTPITVQARFLPETGAPTVKDYIVAPRSRRTVYLNGELGEIGGAAATFSSTTLPFLAERSVYWGVGRVEGTNVVGAPTVSPEWHFAEGASGGQFDTYILLANPGSNDATVWLTLFVEGVGRFTVSNLPQTVPAGKRLTIYMNDFLSQVEAAESPALAPGTLRGKSFSLKATVVNGDPIVAEEAIYWQRDGANFWRAGAAEFGIPNP